MGMGEPRLDAVKIGSRLGGAKEISEVVHQQEFLRDWKERCPVTE